MSQQTINIGTLANDGTGDPIRTAMTKINGNFNEVYSGFAFNTSTNVVTAANTLVVTSNTTTNTLLVISKINVGNAAGYNFGSIALIEVDANSNTYQQVVIQNANSGISASGDFVLTTDTGNDSFGYVDLGINSSQYANSSYTITGYSDAYLYSSNSNMVIGTASANSVIFHSNGTLSTNERMRITANGNIGIGNTTPASTLTVSGNVYVSSNTLTLGSSNIGTLATANGYTVLPNGLLMIWGAFTASNSTPNVISFAASAGVSFPVNCFSVSATSNSGVSSYHAGVYAINATAFTLATGNTTNATVYWQAIGK